MWGNIATKQKQCGGNTVAIHNIFFLNYKAKFSTNSIFKKIDKDNLKKKRSEFWRKKCKIKKKKEGKISKKKQIRGES